MTILRLAAEYPPLDMPADKNAPSQGSRAARSSVVFDQMPPSGITHHHHYYHHQHYRIDPYLMVAILLLLALISWREGWEYGLHRTEVAHRTAPAALATTTSAPPTRTDPAPADMSVPQVSKQGPRPRPTPLSPLGKAVTQPDGTDEPDVIWILRPLNSDGTTANAQAKRPKVHGGRSR